MDKNMFWTVFKADLTFGVCSIIITMLITAAFACWRKKNAKKRLLEGGLQRVPSPQVMVFGGKSKEPGHCPLCGQGWPLSGPEKQETPTS
jgi:hypothetical protein